MKSTRFSGSASGAITYTFVILIIGVLGAALTSVGRLAFLEVVKQSGRFQVYKSLQQDAGKADSLSLIYASVLGNLEKIRQALPAENQASFVLNILVEEAKNKNLTIAGITALDEVPFPKYHEIPFELNFTCDFQNLVLYLNALETHGMILQVRKLTADSEAINKARIKGRLELSVFVPRPDNS